MRRTPTALGAIVLSIAVATSCGSGSGTSDSRDGSDAGNTSDGGDAGNAGDTDDSGNTGDTSDTVDTGDSDDTGQSGVMTELEGIYAIDTWTFNDGACDSEGPSILDTRTQTHVVIKVKVMLGQPRFMVKSCDTIEECRTFASENTFSISYGNLSRADVPGNDADGWVQVGGFSTGGSEEPCEVPIQVFVLTSPSEGTIRIVEETYLVTGVGLDADGKCDREAAAEIALTDGECTEHYVATATFVEGV